MLSVRYPWTLWVLGNVSKTLLAMFPGRPAVPAATSSRPASQQKQKISKIELCPKTFLEFQNVIKKLFGQNIFVLGSEIKFC